MDSVYPLVDTLDVFVTKGSVDTYVTFGITPVIQALVYMVSACAIEIRLNVLANVVTLETCAIVALTGANRIPVNTEFVQMKSALSDVLAILDTQV